MRGSWEGATLAHMIFLSDEDVVRIGETKTGIAYCPVRTSTWVSA